MTKNKLKELMLRKDWACVDINLSSVPEDCRNDFYSFAIDSLWQEEYKHIKSISMVHSEIMRIEFCS